MARGPRPNLNDVIAGASVALVLLPQSLAYAELAGLPPAVGLYAATVPPIVFGLFASSPYLQTGPTAVTSLLTFGALGPLAATGGPEYVALAGLLALLVGGFRTLFGALRAGPLAFFLSRPVLLGFTVGAAVLITASQLPTVLGLPKAHGVLAGAAFALAHPEAWQIESLAVAAMTLLVVVAGRRLHPLFPGVLVAALGGLLYSAYGDYGGATLGAVPEGFVSLHLDLPWRDLPELLLPALILAIVGFAEPTAIARTFAAADRSTWDANREFMSSGAANLASGLFGGMPVGGSFARSALNRLAGARTRLSGTVTGLVMLAFLPFARLLAPLPKPVLGAIILTAVSSLLKFGELRALLRHSRPQAAVALVTLALTLAFAPRVERAVIAGVVLSIVVHAWREMRVSVTTRWSGDTLTLSPRGVLWFPTADALEQRLIELLGSHPAAAEVIIDLSGLGRIDYSGALALDSLARYAKDAAVELCFVHVPTHARRILGAVCPHLLDDEERPAG